MYHGWIQSSGTLTMDEYLSARMTHALTAARGTQIRRTPGQAIALLESNESQVVVETILRSALHDP
jgi:hypothetical protein